MTGKDHIGSQDSGYHSPPMSLSDDDEETPRNSEKEEPSTDISDSVDIQDKCQRVRRRASKRKRNSDYKFIRDKKQGSSDIQSGDQDLESSESDSSDAKLELSASVKKKKRSSMVQCDSQTGNFSNKESLITGKICMPTSLNLAEVLMPNQHAAVNVNVSSGGINKKCPRLIDFTEVPDFPVVALSPFCTYAAGMFDHHGGHLELPSARVKLFIPAGAIKEGIEQPVYIYVTREKRYQPPLNHGEISLSPIIFCGPNGLKFEEDVFLKIPNSASNEGKKWKFQTVSTNTDINEDPVFQKSPEIFSVAEKEFVTIVVNHFTGFGIQGKPDDEVAMENASSDDTQTSEFVEFVPFVQHGGNHVKLRIYGMRSANQRHNEQEMRLGGKQADAERKLSVAKESKADIRITVKPKYWTPSDGNYIQNLPYNTLCETDGDSRSFLFKPQNTDNAVFECDVILQQTGNLDNPSVTFHIHEMYTGVEASQVPSTSDCILSATLMDKMAMLLDIKRDDGNDWRMLAEKLVGLDDTQIRRIDERDSYSPSKVVLNMWEQKTPNAKDIKCLRLFLKDISRDDIVEIIDENFHPDTVDKDKMEQDDVEFLDQNNENCSSFISPSGKKSWQCHSTPLSPRQQHHISMPLINSSITSSFERSSSFADSCYSTTSDREVLDYMSD
ncbi:UNC5C-like protein [Saccoglossus kowalevskii]